MRLCEEHLGCGGVGWIGEMMRLGGLGAEQEGKGVDRGEGTDGMVGANRVGGCPARWVRV